jgi:predicted ester cyclase
MLLLIGAFPDLRFTTELMVADNDLVSVPLRELRFGNCCVLLSVVVAQPWP